MIESVKPLYLKEAVEKPKPQDSNPESDIENEFLGLKRPSINLGSKSPVAKRSKVAVLQEEIKHMFEIVLSKILKIEQQSKKKE
ncbi:unnamed protein product [Parnassius apollo]|uniref:(apollo) hypothetical protein n=1 Tax=Parnassius apollo TaxID=110799 RepID=A0A8S3VXR8_PARAO|nr:unnamed protein product [Parnassius apollo]